MDDNMFGVFCKGHTTRNSYFIQDGEGIYNKLFHPCFGIRFGLLTRMPSLNAS